ncbi:hypothetical protein Patl1_06460 [Pistacia atlantica]|uniref:Uncharacterized protein n=1 Tax=Pistacia atlantica TaxID=434234 RepID=A0ACC1BU32_9ROSI|nr:hypothetical protein Patl1_06460 [Pistacia atlantica]
MDDSYSNISSTHLLGSVPAVVGEENKNTNYEVPEANMETFPPNNGGAGGGSRQGYQTLGTPTEGFEQQPANNWRGVFNVASYQQYFNVDTDIVVNRLMSSLYPFTGDFFSKIDANPDLYGLIWISTTLVFVLASLGNCGTYLMEKHTSSSTSWSFDVSYINVAASVIYGYAILVPLAYYFLIQYMGSHASLVRFWCLWGYSLFVFIVSSFLLLVPVEFLRWVIILITGTVSSCFVALNLRSYIEGNDLTILVVASFFLQMALAVFIKAWFFP